MFRHFIAYQLVDCERESSEFFNQEKEKTQKKKLYKAKKIAFPFYFFGVLPVY
jgi:hypothetical protein